MFRFTTWNKHHNAQEQPPLATAQAEHWHWFPANLSGAEPDTLCGSAGSDLELLVAPEEEAVYVGVLGKQLRGLSERGRLGRHEVTHWVSLWDVIDPFLLLTGGNLHNRPAHSENSQESPLPRGRFTFLSQHCDTAVANTTSPPHPPQSSRVISLLFLVGMVGIKISQVKAYLLG